MATYADLESYERIARALLNTPTMPAPPPSPTNGPTDAPDPYSGRYATTEHGPLAPLRPKGLR